MIDETIFEKSVEDLLKSDKLDSNDKKIIKNEYNLLASKGFKTHMSVAIKILNFFKDNNYSYEIEGPLGISFILYYLGFIKDNPLIGVFSFVSELPLIIRMKWGNNFNRAHNHMREVMLQDENGRVVYNISKKEKMKYFVKYQPSFIYMFDRELDKECMILNDDFRIKRRCFPITKVNKLETKGMYIELKLIV